MVKGFKDFILRGNVVDLAVAVVIGAAFATVITSFTAGVINPLIASAGGGDSPGLGFFVREGNAATFVDFGGIITALINFVIVAAVIYFVDRGADRAPDGASQARRGARGGRDPGGHRAAPGDPRPAQGPARPHPLTLPSSCRGFRRSGRSGDQMCGRRMRVAGVTSGAGAPG